jgi:uncharacterized C2H2 Zn-finger protein
MKDKVYQIEIWEGDSISVTGQTTLASVRQQFRRASSHQSRSHTMAIGAAIEAPKGEAFVYYDHRVEDRSRAFAGYKKVLTRPTEEKIKEARCGWIIHAKRDGDKIVSKAIDWEVFVENAS